MTSAINPHTSEQITAWLRGLLTVAWADNNFDAQEQELIAALTQEDVSPKLNLESLEPITSEELAQLLGQDTSTAENFLRTAVMVAIADGTYSVAEEQILSQFCEALKQPQQVLEALRHTLYDPQSTAQPDTPNALQPVQNWLDGLAIQDPKVARFLCKMIPPQCPFERDVKLFGQKIVHIPPLCKLNPLYEQMVGLRFRALSYLADECKEDVSPYC